MDKKTLESILEVTKATAATLDPEKILSVIVSKVAETIGATRCSIVLVVSENEGYVLVSQDNPKLHDYRVDLMNYPEIREVVHSKSPLVIRDMASHPVMANVRERISGLDDVSLLIVPIVFNEEVLGTLFLRARKGKKGFTKKEIDYCQIVSGIAFHALRNAKLFQKALQEKERLKEEAIKDHLTGLYNHNFFYTRLDEEFDRSVRYGAPLSLIMADIDDFKRINDTYGHRAGDDVLTQVAAMIKKGVRKTDFVARYGGEEFAVILPHTPQKGATEEAERIRTLIESHAYAHLAMEKITVSIGVASYPSPHVMNAGDLVNLADDALYRAKHRGKNCVEVAGVGTAAPVLKKRQGRP